jgi:hypothetical protein
MRVIRYDVVEALSLPKLVSKVDDLISVGWQPLGGVAVGEGEMRTIYAQAMVFYAS